MRLARADRRSMLLAANNVGRPADRDPYFSNVVSLLHFDTGTTTITDVKGKTWSRFGDAAADGAAKFGAYALDLDGTGDYLSSADNADWEFGAGDFTVELFVNMPTSGAAILVSKRASASTQYGYYLLFDSTLGLTFHYSTNGTAVAGTATSSGWFPTNNTWHHIAVSRVGTNLYLFADGDTKTTHNIGTSNIFNGTAALLVGAVNSSSPVAVGAMRIDEFRVTKGVGRYSANFTPPTAAFPDA